jgi:signal transduction histidine kinase
MLLTGLYQADEGQIFFDGKELLWPFQARDLGMETIHKTPDLVDDMDITSNIFLGTEIEWPRQIKWVRIPNIRKMDVEAERILSELDVQIGSLREKAGNLTSDQRQLIAIARALTRAHKMVVIDDPASLLSYAYEQKLLSLIQMWQEQGAAIIFNSNNLDHLFAVTDRIIVLHLGRVIAEYRSDEADRESIVAAIVGSTDRQQITPFIWALESYQRAREQAELLNKKQTTLEKDLAVQGTLNQQLVEQWSRQIEALDHANRALQDAQRRLLTEREGERKLVAREIHDLVIQELVGLSYELEEIETVESLPLAAYEGLIGIRESVQDLVDDLRHICGNLRPPTIDSLGLGTALQSYIHEWSSRNEITVILDLDPKLGRLTETIELSIFRIIQEGLNNVRQHAEASSVEIFLKHTSPRSMVVSIADNGKGLPEDFDLSKVSVEGHYGLLGISERVALLGGHLKVQNQAEGGLLIEAEIPHPRSP